MNHPTQQGYLYYFTQEVRLLLEPPKLRCCTSVRTVLLSDADDSPQETPETPEKLPSCLHQIDSVSQ